MKRNKATTTRKGVKPVSGEIVSGASNVKQTKQSEVCLQNEKVRSNTSFQEQLHKNRLATASSVTEFVFNKKRVRVISDAKKVDETATAVIYWMSRDARVQDNWAFLFAQRLSKKLELPLIVCFCLVPEFLNATIRHFKFLLEGLREVEAECLNLQISFQLLLGPAGDKIPEFTREHGIGAVVCDFSPLRIPKLWLESVKNNLPDHVPLIQADAHNIVPVWIASDKQEYAARTIRGKITSQLSEFLTEFPPVTKHPYVFKDCVFPKVDWNSAYASLACDMSVDEVQWAKAGYAGGCEQLENFCNRRLRSYYEKRNDPTVDALSNLSPWFHFGQISVQRSILEVNRFKPKFKDSVESFCEEAIVRRELSDNFCYYNKNYDCLKSIAAWAFKTLDDHRKDKRKPCYTLAEFENASTHEDLWNAAQIQLMREGKMHGFMRMYWAKKILEWSESPEKALEIAILLNDKYSLDGRDPNGYVGILWSIGGLHDRPFTERDIYGKIRYMSYFGCKKKFIIETYVAKCDQKT